MARARRLLFLQIWNKWLDESKCVACDDNCAACFGTTSHQCDNVLVDMIILVEQLNVSGGVLGL